MEKVSFKNEKTSIYKHHVYMTNQIVCEFNYCLHVLYSHGKIDSSLLFRDINKVMNLKSIPEVKGDKEIEEKAIFVKIICYCLSMMTTEECLILWNEYFVSREDEWWEKLYSLSTFHRKKKVALVNFLKILGQADINRNFCISR